MTSKTRSYRPSPALIVACVALVMALTGSAIAAGVAKNSVRSPQIVDATIRTVDLRDNAVNSAKIAPDQVGTEEIGKDQVGTDELAENSVTSAEVAPDSLAAGDLAAASVGSSEVTDNSLTASDLGPDSVGSSEIAADSVGPSELQASSVRSAELAAIVQVSKDATINAGTNESVSVACPAGTSVISGGARSSLYSIHLASSYRSGNGWHVDAHSNSGANGTITAYAYCLSA